MTAMVEIKFISSIVKYSKPESFGRKISKFDLKFSDVVHGMKKLVYLPLKKLAFIMLVHAYLRYTKPAAFIHDNKFVLNNVWTVSVNGTVVVDMRKCI